MSRSNYDMIVSHRLDFGAAGYNTNPSLIKGDGDGTVNKRSLIGCGYWENSAAQGNHEIHQQAFPGVEHYNMLSDPGAINYILSKLTRDNDYPWVNETKPDSEDIMKIRLF